MGRKKPGPPKGGQFTIGPEHWCGARKKDGLLCRMAKLKTGPRCSKHDTQRDDVWASPGAAATAELDIPDVPLNDVQDVIQFLSAVIHAVKSNKFNKDIAKVVGDLSKTLLMAMKQRDDNSPAGQEKLLAEAAAIKTIVSNMGSGRASLVLQQNNLLITEHVIDVELKEVCDGNKEVRQDAVSKRGKGVPADATATDPGGTSAT